MPDPLPTLIVSDVHIGFCGSLVRSPQDLAPLFDSSRRVVFNGDTVEQRDPTLRDESFAILDALRNEASRYGCEAVFLTGNHDPVASEHHHLDLFDRAMLVTHGDVLYSSITPWSANSQHLEQAHERLLEDLSFSEYELLERHLRASKQVSLMVSYRPSRIRRGVPGLAAALVRECWPPLKPLNILRVWRDASTHAFDTLDRFRPETRFIVFGHIHFPGIWHDDAGRTAINTGSFTPLFGPRAVMLEEDSLSVVTLRRRRGRFYPAKPHPESAFPIPSRMAVAEI